MLQRNVNIRNILCSNSHGLLAIAENDLFTFIDPSNLLDDPTGGPSYQRSSYYGSSNAAGASSSTPMDASQVKILAKSTSIGFPIMGMRFNRNNEGFLAVFGLKDLVVFTLDPTTANVESKLSVDLMLDALGQGDLIVSVEWIAHSQTHLAVAATSFIKVYDLSEDNISPSFYISLLEGGNITAFTAAPYWVYDPSQERPFPGQDPTQ